MSQTIPGIVYDNLCTSQITKGKEERTGRDKSGHITSVLNITTFGKVLKKCQESTKGVPGLRVHAGKVIYDG